MAKSRKQQSALLLAGAAAGVAAAWLSRRRSNLASAESQPLVESTSAELPLGRSADPDIDHGLSRKHLPQNETTGASLLGDEAPESTPAESSLDDLWRAVPDLAEPEQAEGYDAIAPEDLGAVWLERATETEPDPHTPALESQLPPELEGALMSASSIRSAHALETLDELDDLDAEVDDLDAFERERAPESTRQPAKVPKKNAS